MATPSKIVAALASGTQETNLALAHFNFDFSLIKVSLLQIVKITVCADIDSWTPRHRSRRLELFSLGNERSRRKVGLHMLRHEN